MTINREVLNTQRQSLRATEERFLANNIGEKWLQLARDLGLSITEQEEIRERRTPRVQSVLDIIDKWKQKMGPCATKQNMIDVLVKLDRQDLAQQLQNETFIKTDLRHTDCNEIISRLKQKYQNSECVSPALWINRHMTISDKYVDVRLHQIIRKGKEQKQDVTLDNLFCLIEGTDNHNRETYWIYAKPGYGKSTLLKKIAYDWSKGKEYVNTTFDVVIWIPLREITGSIEEEIEKAALCTKHHLMQMRVLLLLDGYDEIPSGDHPDLSDLLRGVMYPHMSIVVTSRSPPGLAEKSLVFWDHIIEVKGLTKENQKKLWTRYNRNADSSMQTVDEIGLEGLLECPLFILFIVFNDNFSINKTKIFSKFLNFLIRRNLLREGIIDIHTPIDLFKTVTVPLFLRIFIFWDIEIVRRLQNNFPLLRVLHKTCLILVAIFIFWIPFIVPFRVPLIMFLPCAVLHFIKLTHNTNWRNHIGYRLIRKIVVFIGLLVILHILIVLLVILLLQRYSIFQAVWLICDDCTIAWLALLLVFLKPYFTFISLPVQPNDESFYYLHMLMCLGKLVNAKKQHGPYFNTNDVLEACNNDKNILKLGILFQHSDEMQDECVTLLHESFAEFCAFLYNVTLFTGDYKFGMIWMPTPKKTNNVGLHFHTTEIFKLSPSITHVYLCAQLVFILAVVCSTYDHKSSLCQHTFPLSPNFYFLDYTIKIGSYLQLCAYMFTQVNHLFGKLLIVADYADDEDHVLIPYMLLRSVYNYGIN